jgi:shikimate dehydrogenase
MKIDENTKVMARLHREPNKLGLNIYNSYFDEADINALYLMFCNPDPQPLIAGLKDLNIAGAITAGFEHNESFFELVDELDPLATNTHCIASVVQRNGHTKGYYQGGYGIFESIEKMTNIQDKKLVVLGAGRVVTGLLSVFKLRNKFPASIEIYNRSLVKAEKLASKFDFVSKIGTIKDMEKKAEGEIFLNATPVGSCWNKGEDYQFTTRFINRFKYIADVTFLPIKPQLIKVSEQLGKIYSPGWKMFLYQAKMCLEKILEIQVDEKILGRKIIDDFSNNW